MDKFKIGTKYYHNDVSWQKRTIIQIAPKKDYSGDWSYFVEVDDSEKGEVFYLVDYGSEMYDVTIV